MAVYALLDVVAPEGTGAEALTWLTTAGAAGMAAGAALAGALAGAGRSRARWRCRRSGAFAGVPRSWWRGAGR